MQLEVFRFDGINLTDPSGPSADLDFGFQARPCIRETYTGGATRYYARDLTHAFYVSAGQSDRVFKLANWSANAAPGNPVFATMTLTSGLTQTPDGEPGSGQLSWLFKLVHTPR